MHTYIPTYFYISPYPCPCPYPLPFLPPLLSPLNSPSLPFSLLLLSEGYKTLIKKEIFFSLIQLDFRTISRSSGDSF